MSTAEKLALSGFEICKMYGRQVGRVNFRDLSESFFVTYAQGAGLTNGATFQVEAGGEDGETEEWLRSITLTLGEDDVLDCVSLRLDAEMYGAIKALLDNDLTIQNLNEPLNGSKSATYIFDGGVAMIHLPLFQAEMSLEYRSSKLMDVWIKTVVEAPE